MKRSSTIDEFILDLTNRSSQHVSPKEIYNIIGDKYVFIKIAYGATTYLIQTAYKNITGDNNELWNFYSGYNQSGGDFEGYAIQIDTTDGSYTIGEY